MLPFGVCRWRLARRRALYLLDAQRFGPHFPLGSFALYHDETLLVEDYIHRIGRTGRAGKRGVSYTFFHQGDKARAGELVNVLQVRWGVATFEVDEFLVGEALCFEGFQHILRLSCGACFCGALIFSS